MGVCRNHRGKLELKNQFITNFCRFLHVSRQHFSYHSCVHHRKRRKREEKYPTKSLKLSFTGSLKVWWFVANAIFAAPGKVNPERRISLTKAACLRGWGIILQSVTWIDLEGEGSVARTATKYADGDRGQQKVEVDLTGQLGLAARWSLEDNDGAPRLSSHHHTHTRGGSDPG